MRTNDGSVGMFTGYCVQHDINRHLTKSSIRQLLDEKWRKVYKACAPRGL